MNYYVHVLCVVFPAMYDVIVTSLVFDEQLFEGNETLQV